MHKHSIIVRADWDAEAGVWVATSNDIDGLAVEADTLELIADKVRQAITDLVELNGFDSGGADVPVHLMAERMMKVPSPCAA